MIDLIIKEKDESISYEDLLEVIHKAFLGRLKEGMKFTALNYDLNTVKNIVDSGYTYCAIYNNKIVGTLTLIINKGVNNKRNGYISTVAIDPLFQGMGIGYKLKEKAISKAKELNCEYVLGNSSIHAKNVKRINKKFGYRIVGYGSDSKTNYYSYIYIGYNWLHLLFGIIVLLPTLFFYYHT